MPRQSSFDAKSTSSPDDSADEVDSIPESGSESAPDPVRVGEQFCLHCGRTRNRSRGLCHVCYADTEIRAKYPILTDKKYSGNRISDANRGVPLEPTQARPGSEEKILVMIKRYEEGSQLFHPKDRRYEREGDEVDLTDAEREEVEAWRGHGARMDQANYREGRSLKAFQSQEDTGEQEEPRSAKSARRGRRPKNREPEEE